MKRNDENSIFWVWNVANNALSSGNFLNYGKSAGVKVLTNIMSGWMKWMKMDGTTLSGRISFGQSAAWASRPLKLLVYYQKTLKRP